MKLIGFDEVIQKLNDLDNAMEKKIIRRGQRDGCKEWQSEAKAQAPIKSGQTRAAIKIRSGGTKQGVSRMNVGVGAKDFTGEAFYAGFVLYGHKVGKRALGDKRKSVKANNWLGRAFASKSEAVIEKTAQSIAAQIQEQAEK